MFHIMLFHKFPLQMAISVIVWVQRLSFKAMPRGGEFSKEKNWIS